jgi:hypothetical protein
MTYLGYSGLDLDPRLLHSYDLMGFTQPGLTYSQIPAFFGDSTHLQLEEEHDRSYGKKLPPVLVVFLYLANADFDSFDSPFHRKSSYIRQSKTIRGNHAQTDEEDAPTEGHWSSRHEDQEEIQV